MLSFAASTACPSWSMSTGVGHAAVALRLRMQGGAVNEVHGVFAFGENPIENLTPPGASGG